MFKITVILSFLKRGRERFPLFVLRRYRQTRMFLGILDRYMNVTEGSMRVLDRLWPFQDQKSAETVMKRSETVTNVGRSGTANGQGRWATWNVHTVQDERSETFGKSRSRFKYERIAVLKILYFIDSVVVQAGLAEVEYALAVAHRQRLFWLFELSLADLAICYSLHRLNYIPYNKW